MQQIQLFFDTTFLQQSRTLQSVPIKIYTFGLNATAFISDILRTPCTLLHILWKKFVQKILCLFLLVKIVFRHLIHQAFHTIGILFHPIQQTLHHCRHCFGAEKLQVDQVKLVKSTEIIKILLVKFGENTPQRDKVRSAQRLRGLNSTASSGKC